MIIFDQIDAVQKVMLQGELSGIDTNHTLVLGNFYCHSPSWYVNKAEEKRGLLLLE